MERRVEARVIGPGAPGCIRMRLGQREQDVPAERVPPSLRIPNALFVAVVDRGQFQRVEPAGREWLEIQDRIRAVLNEDWDPIGVAGDVDDDEYDSYIAPIYHLLREGATPAGLADYLLQIETERMELHGLPGERRLRRRAGAREKRSPLAARL